jgi:AcrR family transcriptional regulator
LALVPSAPAESEKAIGPRSRKGERTRLRLLDAAKQIFEEQGYFDARISDIAERAGLSHGSFYHYFESKEQAFREVASAVDLELSAPFQDVILAPLSNDPPHDRIHEAVRQHFERYAREARILGVIEQVARHDEVVNAVRSELHGRMTEQIAESIGELQERRLADPTLDPMLTAAALGAMTFRFAEMWLVQGAVDCPLDEGIQQVARVIVNALDVPRAGG